MTGRGGREERRTGETGKRTEKEDTRREKKGVI